MGYIRVWHFAASIKTPIAVSLVVGNGPPLILGRSMVAGRLASYRDVPPGRYKSAIRASAADQGANISAPELLPPAVIDVADRTFQTILIQDGGGPKVSVLNDGTIGGSLPKGGKRMRIFNFAPGQAVSLKVLPSEEIISSSVPAGASQHIFPSNPGKLTTVMSNKLRNGHEAQQYLELDFSRCDSISIVIMLDRYDRLTFEAAEDTKID
jgi:hypothetical protein